LSDVLLPKLSKGDILVYILLHPQPASPRIEKRWVGVPAPNAKNMEENMFLGFLMNACRSRPVSKNVQKAFIS